MAGGEQATSNPAQLIRTRFVSPPPPTRFYDRTCAFNQVNSCALVQGWFAFEPRAQKVEATRGLFGSGAEWRRMRLGNTASPHRSHPDSHFAFPIFDEVPSRLQSGCCNGRPAIQWIISGCRSITIHWLLEDSGQRVQQRLSPGIAGEHRRVIRGRRWIVRVGCECSARVGPPRATPGPNSYEFGYRTCWEGPPTLGKREVPPTPWRNLFVDIAPRKISAYDDENRGSAKSWGTPPRRFSRGQLERRRLSPTILPSARAFAMRVVGNWQESSG